MSKVLRLLVHEFKFVETARQVACRASALGHAVQRRSGGAEVPVHEHLVFKAELEAAFADQGGFDVYEFSVVGGLPEPDV